MFLNSYNLTYNTTNLAVRSSLDFYLKPLNIYFLQSEIKRPWAERLINEKEGNIKDMLKTVYKLLQNDSVISNNNISTTHLQIRSWLQFQNA